MVVDEVITVKSRGFCAGVDRAIELVEDCLDLYGKPVYVKHAIVHNDYVVKQLAKKGAITVEDPNDIPEGSTVVFSAHGSTPKQFADAKKRNLNLIDATCPLVTKVHLEVRKFHKEGYEIIYIGKNNHPEAVSVLEQLPKNTIHFVEKKDDVKQISLLQEEKIVYLTQTTLGVDQTKEIINSLKEKFPKITAPSKEDICYATTNRQEAVKELAKHTELILVVGSKTSSNANQLVKTAQLANVKAYLINNKEDINPLWLTNISKVGVTGGASTPEVLMQEVINYFDQAKSKEIAVTDEQYIFIKPKLPKK